MNISNKSFLEGVGDGEIFQILLNILIFLFAVKVSLI